MAERLSGISIDIVQGEEPGHQPRLLALFLEITPLVDNCRPDHLGAAMSVPGANREGTVMAARPRRQVG